MPGFVYDDPIKPIMDDYLPNHWLEHRLVACRLIQNEVKNQKNHMASFAVYEIFEIIAKNRENRIHVSTFYRFFNFGIHMACDVSFWRFSFQLS